MHPPFLGKSIWVIVMVATVLGTGCSTFFADIDPLGDYLDSRSRDERERYYQNRGYDEKSSRRAAEEDEMIEWFEK